MSNIGIKSDNGREHFPQLNIKRRRRRRRSFPLFFSTPWHFSPCILSCWKWIAVLNCSSRKMLSSSFWCKKKNVLRTKVDPTSLSHWWIPACHTICLFLFHPHVFAYLLYILPNYAICTLSVSQEDRHALLQTSGHERTFLVVKKGNEKWAPSDATALLLPCWWN